jgi:sulfide dehydrogenase cytochrome subunit
MRFPRLLVSMPLLFCHPCQSADAPLPQRAPIAALGCGGCHGESGEGHGSIPRISGKPEAEFLHKMQEFRANQRQATVMNRIARGLDNEDLALLAKYFSHK